MKPIEFEHAFDPRRCRHLLERRVSVLHCHHYSTLYTQLAEDCSFLDACALLARVAADTFFALLMEVQRKNDLRAAAERIAVAEQYYAWAGLGRLKVTAAGPDAGEAVLERSHIDEGWVRKWGRRERPVNFITQGFLAAVFASAFDARPEQYAVRELESIVSGRERSRFQIARQ